MYPSLQNKVRCKSASQTWSWLLIKSQQTCAVPPRVQTLGRPRLKGSGGGTCRSELRAQKKAEKARLLHLGLEMDPMLVCLFVMERHPRVRQIIHQVVPVPRRHHRRQADRRRCSFGSTRRYRPDSKRSSPVRDSRVSSRCKRSPLLLPWASKGPILKRGHVCAPLTLSPRDNEGFSFWPVCWKRCAQQRKDRVSGAGRGKSSAGVAALLRPVGGGNAATVSPLPISPPSPKHKAKASLEQS